MLRVPVNRIDKKATALGTLDVSEESVLGGRLELIPSHGFTAAAGDTISALSASAWSGSLGAITLPGSPLKWTAAISERDVVITASRDAVVNTKVPTIDASSAQVGRTLKALPGTWTPVRASFSYQWLRNGAVIAGATSATYTPVAADLGAKLSVRVAAQVEGYTAGTAVSSALIVAAGSLTSATPKVTGTPQIGATLAVSRGTWSSGTTFRYQWYLDGRAISGATGATWKITSAAAGKQITVRVTGSKAGFTSVSKTSAATMRVLKPGSVRVSGTAKVGRTLTVSRGTWTSGTAFTYQWYSNGKAIKGATKTTLKVASSMRGAQISVKVTGAKKGYASVSVTSPRTREVVR